MRTSYSYHQAHKRLWFLDLFTWDWMHLDLDQEDASGAAVVAELTKDTM